MTMLLCLLALLLWGLVVQPGLTIGVVVALLALLVVAQLGQVILVLTEIWLVWSWRRRRKVR